MSTSGFLVAGNVEFLDPTITAFATGHVHSGHVSHSVRGRGDGATLLSLGLSSEMAIEMARHLLNVAWFVLDKAAPVAAEGEPC